MLELWDICRDDGQQVVNPVGREKNPDIAPPQKNCRIDQSCDKGKHQGIRALPEVENRKKNGREHDRSGHGLAFCEEVAQKPGPEKGFFSQNSQEGVCQKQSPQYRITPIREILLPG